MSAAAHAPPCTGTAVPACASVSRPSCSRPTLRPMQRAPLRVVLARGGGSKPSWSTTARRPHWHRRPAWHRLHAWQRAPLHTGACIAACLRPAALRKYCCLRGRASRSGAWPAERPRHGTRRALPAAVGACTARWPPLSARTTSAPRRTRRLVAAGWRSCCSARHHHCPRSRPACLTSRPAARHTCARRRGCPPLARRRSGSAAAAPWHGMPRARVGLPTAAAASYKTHLPSATSHGPPAAASAQSSSRCRAARPPWPTAARGAASRRRAARPPAPASCRKGRTRSAQRRIPTSCSRCGRPRPRACMRRAVRHAAAASTAAATCQVPRPCRGGRYPWRRLRLWGANTRRCTPCLGTARPPAPQRWACAHHSCWTTRRRPQGPMRVRS